MIARVCRALLCLALLVCPTSRAFAFACITVNGHCMRWFENAAVLRSLLGNAGGTLINATTSWDMNAVSAADEWNLVGTPLHFTVDIGGQFINPCGARGDGHVCANSGPAGDNPVFFANDFCGRAFGDIIELTNTCADSNSGAIYNAPVFVNSFGVPLAQQPNLMRSWNAYDGAIRFPGPNQVVYDIRRVLLHEFGHVLGLAHPDDNGQHVVAIMNSHVSDLDRLQVDDISGMQSLYPNSVASASGQSAGATTGCHIAPDGHFAAPWLLLPALLVALHPLKRSSVHALKR